MRRAASFLLGAIALPLLGCDPCEPCSIDVYWTVDVQLRDPLADDDDVAVELTVDGVTSTTRCRPARSGGEPTRCEFAELVDDSAKVVFVPAWHDSYLDEASGVLTLSIGLLGNQEQPPEQIALTLSAPSWTTDVHTTIEPERVEEPSGCEVCSTLLELQDTIEQPAPG